MKHASVIVVGGGQAGLSTSYCLSRKQVDHVIFEKGRIGEVWRSQRWDSFRLNTPNWSNVLPGEEYKGRDRDAFESAEWFATYLSKYAGKHHLPIREHAAVVSLEKDRERNLFLLEVKEKDVVDRWSCNQIVVASGILNTSKIPGIADSLPSSIVQHHASTYKNPQQLPKGAVLIAGSAQSGCQIAEDLLAAGRKVFLATGKAGRLPRSYRGKDIVQWIAITKFLDMRPDQLPDKNMMKAPQGQVSGVGPRGKSTSLQYLHKKGAVILGHLVNFKENMFLFSDDAAENVKEGDQFSMKVKNMIDQFISENRMLTPPATFDEGDEADPDAQCVSHITSLDAAKENITSVIWTTGFSSDFSWLRLPVFDSAGEPIHNEGRSPVAGLYFIGFPWLRTRKSGIIYGMNDDANFIAGLVQSELQKNSTIK